MAEEVQEKTYTEIEDDAPLGVSGGTGGGGFDDYVTLPVEEPIKAHVVDVKLREKTKYKSTETEERMFFWFEVDEGEGKGQRYRWDCKPTLTQGKGKKLSNFDELMKKLVGKLAAPGEYSKKEIIGLPCRIELGEPWGDKGLQFVKAFKAPSSDQQIVKVEKQEDVVPNDPMAEITSDALDALFD